MPNIYKKLITDPDLYYRKLFASGWLDEWCEEELAILYEDLQDMVRNSPEFTVYVLSEYTLEPEGVCIPQAYVNVLLDLMNTFDLKLLPEDIEAVMDGSHIELSVKTPKQEVVWRFKQNDDWMDDDFLDFVNDELLPHWNERRIFHPLPPSSTSIDLVFQYPEVIDTAENMGLIPPDEYYLP